MQRIKGQSGLMFILLLTILGCSPKVESTSNASGIKIMAVPTVNPLLVRYEFNPAIRLELTIPEGKSSMLLSSMEGQLDVKNLKDIYKLEVYRTSESKDMQKGERIASLEPDAKNFSIPIKTSLSPGVHHLWLNVLLKPGADMDGFVRLKVTGLKDASDKLYAIKQPQLSKHRIGLALRKPMDEGVKSYRIPGITTTDKGTLISVYDIRYDGSRDLPANIDVGMNRSTDGGKTWSAMQNIMDMGGPNDNSGVGDPAVLFDPATKTIWVAALWSKGNRSIAGSGPGLSPDETGQFVVTKSTDDGLTWSKPYSITNQVKNPEWRLFFPGPGNGIAMSDGKIVFAAQYWDANKMPHSTLIYSDDHGKSWKSGVGAKSNTTESQLVEIAPGTLMLNMRDNRGKFRSVALTKDMGQTWTEHATSYNALPDPVCMASFIKARVNVKGTMRNVLFFSNPNESGRSRHNITIKASLDNGETWQNANSLLLDERLCDGYSALTRIDDNTLGILYEGVSRMQFLRISVKDILN